jgi:hypothetical protein
MADTEPPHMAPAKMAPIRIKAESGVIPKVRGIKMAMPMAAVNPGRAPNMFPTITPAAEMNRFFRLNTPANTSIRLTFTEKLLGGYYMRKPSGKETDSSLWKTI